MGQYVLKDVSDGETIPVFRRRLVQDYLDFDECVMNRKAASSSETVVTTYELTWRHGPGDLNLQVNCLEIYSINHSTFILFNSSELNHKQEALLSGTKVSTQVSLLTLCSSTVSCTISTNLSVKQ